MPPGRRITRFTAQSEQETPTNDTNTSITEAGCKTHFSRAKNPQVVRRTTRSSVREQQVGSPPKSTIHGEQIGQHTPSSVRMEHPSVVQSEQPNDTTREQPNDTTREQPDDTTGSDQNLTYKSRKATRGMATSKIARAAASGKLSVTFDADCRQPICINAERFNNEIGFIVRNHGTFYYKEWRLVPEEVRAPLRSYLVENFDIDLHDETTKLCIDEQMRKAWKSYKYKLHSHFKNIGGKHDLVMAKKKRHPDFRDDQQEDWEMLCDRWSSTQFQERALKNTVNRTKRKWNSKNGSVSTARHHIRRGMTLTSLTGQIETWRLNHFDENGWTGPELEKLYGNMIKLRSVYSPEEMSDKEILEAVLGRHSVYLRGWGRSAHGKIAKSSQGTSVEPNQPSYKEIVQQLNEATARLNDVVDILRNNNLMQEPMTTPTNQVSDAE